LACLVAVATFAWLDWAHPAFFVTDDALRDVLMARDCAELGQCHAVGPNTSMPGFYHGVLWLDLLTAIHLLGGDSETARGVVLALLATSSATLFIVVWRWLGAFLAPPAAVLFALLLAADSTPAALVNPSAAVFPDLLTAAALLCLALSGRRRFLWIAAFSLGLAINLHFSSVSLSISLLFVIVLAGASARDLVVAVAVPLLVTVATSSASLRANFTAADELGLLLPALLGATMLIAAAQVARLPFARASRTTRAWVTGAALVLPFAAASAALVASGHHYTIAYLHPILAPLAVIGSAVACAPFALAGRRWWQIRWIPTAILAVAIVAEHQSLARQFAPARQVALWSLADAAALSRAVEQLGWSYDDLVYRVQGHECRELLVQMSVFSPPRQTVDARRDARVHLQVRRATAEQPAPILGERVALADGEYALVQPVDSWLRMDALRACRIPIGSAEPAACADAPAAGHAVPAEILFSARSFPEVHDLDLGRPYVAVYEIPLTPERGHSRTLEALDRGAGDCGWWITAVDGAAVDRALPATTVTVTGTGSSNASIRLEKRFHDTVCPPALDMRYPPCLWESPATTTGGNER